MILVVDLEIDPDYRYLGPEIARLLPRETEYVAFVDDPVIPELEAYDGIVLSGSTASVYDEAHNEWIVPASSIVRRCRDEEIPLLGVCFGHQLIHQALGGTVEQDGRRSTFVEMERIESDESVLDDVASIVPVLHADLVTEPGEDLVTTHKTEYNAHFCSRHASAPIWTVQFHPEFTEAVRDRPSDWSDGDHTFDETNATRVLENFAEYCQKR